MREKLLTLIPNDIIKEVNSVLNYYKQEQQIVNLPNKELIRFLAGTIMSFLLSQELLASTREEEEQEIENMICFLTKGLALNQPIDNKYK